MFTRHQTYFSDIAIDVSLQRKCHSAIHVTSELLCSSFEKKTKQKSTSASASNRDRIRLHMYQLSIWRPLTYIERLVVPYLSLAMHRKGRRRRRLPLILSLQILLQVLNRHVVHVSPLVWTSLMDRWLNWFGKTGLSYIGFKSWSTPYVRQW